MTGTAERTLIRLEEVERRTSLTRSAIYRRLRAGTFPRPIKLGHRSLVWVEEEVDRFVETLIAERDGHEAAG